MQSVKTLRWREFLTFFFEHISSLQFVQTLWLALSTPFLKIEYSIFTSREDYMAFVDGTTMFRSSHWKCFIKKAFKTFAIFT